MSSLNWLIKWFAENGNNVDNIEDHLNENYFDLEYIDSFTFIMLISAIEDELGISFDNVEFQKREFATINGLAKIIEEKRI